VTARVAGLAELLLLVSLFFPWFGYNSGLYIVTGDGLSAHWFLYLPLCISIAVIALIGLEMLGLVSWPARSPVGQHHALLISAAISFVLVLIGFADKPGLVGYGWSWGSVIALVAAFVALLLLARPEQSTR
jgi:hypothetical protein